MRPVPLEPQLAAVGATQSSTGKKGSRGRKNNAGDDDTRVRGSIEGGNTTTMRSNATLGGCGGIATAKVKKRVRARPGGENTSWYRGGASSMTSPIAEVVSEMNSDRPFDTGIRPSVKTDANKSSDPTFCTEFVRDIGTPSGQDFGQDIGPNFGPNSGPNFGTDFGTDSGCYGV